MSDGNKCFRCLHLERFYVMGNNKFNKTQYGFCCIKRDFVHIQEWCESYTKRPNRKTVSRQMQECLSDLLAEITSIRYVLEECRDKGEGGEV